MTWKIRACVTATTHFPGLSDSFDFNSNHGDSIQFHPEKHVKSQSSRCKNKWTNDFIWEFLFFFMIASYRKYVQPKNAGRGSN